MIKLRYIYIGITLALSALILGACSPFYDDLSQCRDNYLAFSYHADDDTTVEHLPEYLHQIDLFIYNDQNALVQQHKLTQADLDRFQVPMKPGIKLDLAPGNYRAVAVGNLFGQSHLAGEGTYGSEAVVSHKDQPKAGGIVSSGFDSLYLGECALQIVSAGRSENVLTFYSQHVQIDARLSCADAARASQWYADQKTKTFTLTMGAMPAVFSFKPSADNPMEATRSGSLTFQRLPLARQDKELRFGLQYNMLRFSTKDASAVVLKEGNKTLCTVDFSRYISTAINSFMKAKQEGKKYQNSFYDCDRKRMMQEAVIPLHFIQKPVDMTVSVAPWINNDTHPIF